MNLYEYQRSRSMNIKGQGHSLTLVQGQSDSTFSNFFFLETAWPIEAKFYVEPPWDRCMKIWSNGLGHLTKMAAMSCMVKPKKSLQPKGWWPWELVCSIRYSSTSKFVQVMTLGWPWPILRQSQIWSPMLLYGEKCNFVWEKGKTMYYFRNCCSLWYKSW